MSIVLDNYINIKYIVDYNRQLYLNFNFIEYNRQNLYILKYKISHKMCWDSMIKRKIYLNQIERLIDKEPIKIITGVRRSGKTYLLKSIQEGHKQQQINLLNDSPVGALAVANNDIETGLEWSKQQALMQASNTVFLLPSERLDKLKLPKAET